MNPNTAGLDVLTEVAKKNPQLAELMKAALQELHEEIEHIKQEKIKEQK